MTWVKLEFSKRTVRRAGDYLIGNWVKFDTNKFLESYEVLSNWRASHSYPMQSMLGYFRKKAFEVYEHALVVQRLKRAPSLLAKLKRESGMKLDRVEDIAGCRIVVPTKSNVYSVRNKIVNGRTRNILRRERDYIKYPKESGYRGIHLIYRYNGEKSEYSGQHVELQIRSKVQHSWATAVEVVGTFTGQALKASQGKDAWLNFFKLASIAFADIENRKLIENATKKERIELIKYIERIGVQSRLNAFAVSTRHLGNTKINKGDFFLLILEIDKSRIQIIQYKSDEINEANNAYSNKEKKFKDNTEKDVVLVSASSIHNLKRAYPNYFADTNGFTKYLEKVIKANKALLRTTSDAISRQRGN